MRNIITKYNTTGPCEINLENLYKIWDNRFTISLWGDEKYTLVANRKNSSKYLLKCTISIEDAKAIIEKLRLVKIQSATFNSGSTFMNKDVAKEHMEKLQKSYEEKMRDVNFIQREILMYKDAIYE